MVSHLVSQPLEAPRRGHWHLTASPRKSIEKHNWKLILARINERRAHDDVIPWWQSKTIWAAIIAGVAPLIGTIFHFT